jgi:hypothetical protein
VNPDRILKARFWCSPLECVLDIPRMSKTLYIQFSEIADLFPRSYYHRQTALELFLEDGRSFFIDFAPVGNMEILSLFPACALPSISLPELTQQWTHGEISNFSYLMYLNLLAGRSFHDLLQYPVLPNVVCSRDLSRPLKPSLDSDLDLDLLFQESILPPVIVDRALGRLEPFTSVHLRGCGAVNGPESDLINSMESLSEAELPADFYFQSELAKDVNSLGLAELSASPTFASDYRKVLESPRVSSELHLWLDFVFGFRQKGKEAHDLGNLNHPATLDDFWTNNPDTDPAAVLPLMKLYGLTPNQLFRSPHPAKAPYVKATMTTVTHAVSAAPLLFGCRISKGELWLVDVSGMIVGFQFEGSTKVTGRSVPVQKDSVFFGLDGGFAVYESVLGTFRMIFDHGPSVEISLRDIGTFASSGTLFAGLRNRTVLRLFDARSFSEELARIVSTEDAIQCLAINQTNHLLCTATRDDRLHYYSTRHLRQTAAVKMPLSSANRILITDCWGLVAVDFGRKIVLFTVNGEFLTEYEHDCEFAYWTSVSSRSDFDYIVYADVKGNLVMFEAFTTQNSVKLAQLVWPVCFVCYDLGTDSLAVVSTTGKVMVVVHPFAAFPD